MDGLKPLWCNAAEIATFKYGKEDYVVTTYFFQVPPMILQGKSFSPPIQFLPLARVILPREAHKQIAKKFLGHIAQQDEGPIEGGKNEDVI
jgi:hypothetical protein